MRKEINLPPEVLKMLQALADKENRSLKNYMETVLIEHAKKRGKAS